MLLCPILTSENATKASPEGGRGDRSRAGRGHSQQRVGGVGAAGPQPAEHTGSGTRVTWALGSTPDVQVPGLACMTPFPRDSVSFVKAVCKPNFQTRVRIRNDAHRALAHDIGPISHSCTAGHCRTPLPLMLLRTLTFMRCCRDLTLYLYAFACGEIGLLCIISLVAEPIDNVKRGLTVHGECLPTLSPIICLPVCLSIGHLFIIIIIFLAGNTNTTQPPSPGKISCRAGELPGGPRRSPWGSGCL